MADTEANLSAWPIGRIACAVLALLGTCSVIGAVAIGYYFALSPDKMSLLWMDRMFALAFGATVLPLWGIVGSYR